MYEDVLIDEIDYFGRGVAHINKKIVFVNNALKDEVVDIKIIKEKKNFSEAIVINYKVKSSKRVEAICPYFNKCGGCNLLMLSYQDTLNFKLNKAIELLTKSKLIFPNIEVIPNYNHLYYRNKVNLKVINGQVGFYESNTHTLIPITKCCISKKAINDVIENINLLNITNAQLIIRCNTNNEIILIINTNDKENIYISKLKKIIKIVGIIFNDKLIYGTSFFYEKINGLLFKVSFDSFFQVNHDICSSLFKLVEEHITKNSKVLDLYSGVGTLSLVASLKAKEVYSVEIVKNAVLNTIYNASLNEKNNIKALLGDVKRSVLKIKDDFDILIVDPPRKGLDKTTINYILNKKIPKIIYISCDVATLIRDLKMLEKVYIIKEFKILDMFSYSYHFESMCVLKLRQDLINKGQIN